MATIKQNIYPSDTGGQFALYGTSIPSGATVDGIFWKQDGSSYYKRVLDGEMRASYFGILADGNDQTTRLNAALAYDEVKEIIFDEFGGTVIINGTVNANGKTFSFSNKCIIDGTGTISNIVIKSSIEDQCFGQNIQIASIKNKDLYVTNLGFLDTNTAAQNSTALQKISTLINNLGGGINLHFSKRNYLIGKESLRGAYNSGSSYIAATFLTLSNNTKPIFIDGHDATIKLADGLHYGSFDPTTGAIVNPYITINHSGGYAIANGITIAIQPVQISIASGVAVSFPGGGVFTTTAAAATGATTLTGNLTGAAVTNNERGVFYSANGNYVAFQGTFLDATNNESIEINNFTLDGNIANAVIGGKYDDDGIQLPTCGIISVDNKRLFGDNLILKNWPQDGLEIANTIGDVSTPIKEVNFTNTILDGNSRQGMSIVGANHGHFKGVQFINTGKTINSGTGTNFRSSPAAGIDLEQETGFIHNLIFDNCIIENNDGAGLLSVGDVDNVTWNGGKIVGSTSWSLYGLGAGFTFNDATIVGSPVNIFFPKFYNCLITMDYTKSKNGLVYGTYLGDHGGGGGGDYHNCILDGAGRAGIYGYTKMTNSHLIRINGYSFMSGEFNGNNTMYYGTGDAGYQPSGPFHFNSTFNGSLLINGVERAPKKQKFDVIVNADGQTIDGGKVQHNTTGPYSLALSPTEGQDVFLARKNGEAVLPQLVGSSDVLAGIHPDGTVFRATILPDASTPALDAVATVGNITGQSLILREDTVSNNIHNGLYIGNIGTGNNGGRINFIGAQDDDMSEIMGVFDAITGGTIKIAGIENIEDIRHDIIEFRGHTADVKLFKQVGTGVRLLITDANGIIGNIPAYYINGNISIGANSDTGEKLQVNGTVKADSLRIGEFNFDNQEGDTSYQVLQLKPNTGNITPVFRILPSGTGTTSVFEFFDSSSTSDLVGRFLIVNELTKTTIGFSNNYSGTKYLSFVTGSNVEQMTINRDGTVTMRLLKTTSTSPTQSGLIKMITTDSNGLLGFKDIAEFWTASGNDIYNNNSQNVGIGTGSTVPTFKLSVYDNTQYAARVMAGGSLNAGMVIQNRYDIDGGALLELRSSSGISGTTQTNGSIVGQAGSLKLRGGDGQEALVINTGGIANFVSGLINVSAVPASSGAYQNIVRNASTGRMEAAVNNPYAIKSANYTLINSDETIEANAASITLTLPTAVGIVGKKFGVKNTSSGTITINTTSSQTIFTNAAVTSLTLAIGDYFEFQSNGTNYILR